MGYIKKYFIQDLMDKINIVDVIEDYVKLKKQGATYFGLSPFQTEKTPSFNVNPVKQRFTDYSSGKSGNAITFLMEHKNLTFTEAVEEIANKYHEEIQYENSETAKIKAEQEKKRQELRPILQATQKLFIDQFNQLSDDHPAKVEIFKHRKYDEQIVLDWGIGYAPGQKFIYNKVYEKGLTTEAAALNLINPDKKQDKHWNRVTYPIHDANGLLVGFASRDLSGKKTSAKWMNPTNSEVYKKENIWYGLDRALKSKDITTKDEVWIVEGYNDVIAFHEHGLQNTIASSGTNIPENLIKKLKRYCDHVVLCFDGDAAGIKATKNSIPMFLKHGFTVNVLFLPNVDPDDFFRVYKTELNTDPGFFPNEIRSYAEDAFKVLMQIELGGNAIEVSRGAKKLCQVIATIEDEALTEIYTQWLQKESGITKTTINKWLKFEQSVNQREALEITQNSSFVLPGTVKESFKNFQDDIYTYGLFMSNNRIWFATGEDDNGKKHFTSASNFIIEIIQHMQDEKFPSKLIRIKNVHGVEKIFDIPSEYLNTPQQFDNAVTSHGNFLWTAGRNEFQKLRAYLYDKMGNGRKIDVLGWQPEGFWAWNNKINVPGKPEIVLDENGICVYDSTHYYLPSANKIFSKNVFKYDAQKRFQIFTAQTTFQNYTAQMIKVHRNHAINGVLFAIASVFQDIVVKQENFFPIFFLYGPGSSGKDQLADCCQSFFGTPQTAINLEGNVSTIKAQVREFAQFSNSMGHLSEYKRGNQTLNGVIKGLWDRRGYKRGNIESHVGTESIPILSSVILTGNEYPDDSPLIMRFIWNEMVKNEFDEKEMEEFDKLKDMTNAGISSFTVEIIQHRDLFIEKFKKKFRGFKENFQSKVPGAKTRLISNIAVLGATYSIFKDILDFPFTFVEMEKHFINTITLQIRKLEAASMINRFWDCFVAATRGMKGDRLQVGYDFKIEGNSVYFNYTNVYNKVQRQWYSQFHESAPGKSTLRDQLKKDSAYIHYHTSVSLSDKWNDVRTSAFEVNLTKTIVKDELMMAAEYQKNENYSKQKEEETDTSTGTSPPVTPNKNNILENPNQENLPF